MSVRRNPLEPVMTTEDRPPLTVARILAWADAFHEC